MAKDRLLVIDDERGPRESLRFLFKDRYEVVCAESVDHGLAAIRERPVDAVVMDIKMPGKNGIQGLKEIRALDPLVSIVMLTGFGSLETAQEAIRNGATDYLKKPFDTTELRAAIAGYVQRTHLLRKRQAAAEQLETLTAQLREQLEAKEKMATLGEESSEFVHDLNNPLSVINGYVQMLIEDVREKKGADPALTVDYLEQIEKGVARCRDMLTLWRERSRRIDSSVRRIDLGELVAEIAKNMQPLAVAKGAKIQLAAGPACFIEGDNIQVFRAVQNIVGNALEAVRATRGEIRIRWRTDGRRALVEVEDNGGGFPPDKIADMHTRHYTTKGATGGMGLGLFITKNIVQAHGGQLVLANNAAGTGALVTLAFPRLE